MALARVPSNIKARIFSKIEMRRAHLSTKLATKPYYTADLVEPPHKLVQITVSHEER